jgi:hypothetical protein
MPLVKSKSSFLFVEWMRLNLLGMFATDRPTVSALDDDCGETGGMRNDREK